MFYFYFLIENNMKVLLNNLLTLISEVLALAVTPLFYFRNTILETVLVLNTSKTQWNTITKEKYSREIFNTIHSIIYIFLVFLHQLFVFLESYFPGNHFCNQKI